MMGPRTPGHFQQRHITRCFSVAPMLRALKVARARSAMGVLILLFDHTALFRLAGLNSSKRRLSAALELSTFIVQAATHTPINARVAY
jgi:hypothetical protein